MAKELENVLSINGEDYNVNAVNAVEAVHVQNKLTISKMNLDGEVADKIEFDGSSPVGTDEIPFKLVTAEGGRFNGPIRVPNNIDSTIDDEAVLNYNDIKIIYNDIKNNVLANILNNTVLYAWDGTSLDGVSNNAIKGVSFVTGSASGADKFASYNYNKKDDDSTKLSAFIYIANDDGNKGSIFFGTKLADSTVNVQVNAEVANKLVNSKTIRTKLDSNTAVGFDGTANIEPGVTGILPLANGGLGGDISSASSQAAKTAEYYINGSIGESTAQVTDNTWMLFRHNLPSLTAGQYCRKQASMFWNYIAGKIRTIFGFTSSNVLSASNGGTGQTNLDNVTVGTSKKIQSTLRTPSGYRTLNTTLTINTVAPNSADGNEGDIWITYSNS